MSINFESYMLIAMALTSSLSRWLPEGCDKSATVNTSSMLAIKLLGSYLIARLEEIMPRIKKE